MSVPKPIDVLHDWFERVWNQGNENAIDELYSAAGVVHGLPTADGAPIAGRDAFKPFFHNFRAAFPDIKVVVSQTLSEGNLCAAYCEVTATHTGHGLGVDPTGRDVRFSGVAIARIQDGQMQEAWNSFNFLSLYQQLGLVDFGKTQA